MSREIIKQTYKPETLDKDIKISRFNNILPYIEHYLPTDKRLNILDAGCGTGNYTRYLMKLGYQNVNACDLFDSLPYPEINYLKASLDKLPFPDNYFSFIFSASVLYYLNSPEDGIKELRRVLKPGGFLIVSAHTRYSLFTLYRWLKYKLGVLGAHHFRYVNFYSSRRYLALYRKYGFTVSKRDGYNLSFLLFPVYKYVARAIEIICKIRMPFMDIKITKNKILATIKSEIAYHSVIVVKASDE